jgi:membrane protein
MLIAAWTKEASLDAESAAESASEAAGEAEAAERASAPAEREPLLPGPPGKRYKVVPVPSRQADSVAVAAGAVLGVTLTPLAVQGLRAVRSIRRQ